jgi:hypothetical protein
MDFLRRSRSLAHEQTDGGQEMFGIDAERDSVHFNGMREMSIGWLHK